MTYREVLDSRTDKLVSTGVDEAKLNIWYLLVDAAARFGVHIDDRSWIHIHGDDEADDEMISRLDGYIRERMTGKPLEYIIGYTEFMGLRIETDERALIPRQDTECLVEQVLRVCEDKSVIELCTGTGCIAIAIGVLGNPRHICATDISGDALELARANCSSQGADIEFIRSDVWDDIDGKYDIIVANPPYIRTDVIPELMREVREYEPTTALDGGTDGLDIYRRIIDGTGDHINPDGRVLFEIGYDQADQVSRLLRDAGYIDIEVIQDYAGLDRVVTCKEG